jgi:hypothetical protein
VNTIAHKTGFAFTLEAAVPAPVDPIQEQVLAALRAYYSEHHGPMSVKALACVTHRRTQAVVAAVRSLVGEGLAQRLGKQGKRGMVPMPGEAHQHR